MKPIKTLTALIKFSNQLRDLGMSQASYLPGYSEYVGFGLRIRILSFCTSPTVVEIANDKCFDRWANSTVFSITGIPVDTFKMIHLARAILRLNTFDQCYISSPLLLPVEVYALSDRVETIRMFLVIPTIDTEVKCWVKAWIPNNAHIVDMNVGGMTLNVAHEAEFKDTGVTETYFKLKKTGSTIRSFHRDSRGACYTGHGYALIK